MFDHWRKSLGHPAAKLDKKREARICWALSEYGMEKALAAIDGCAASPFNRGDNRDGRVYDDPTLIFRDAEHVERFLAVPIEPTEPPPEPAAPPDKPLTPEEIKARPPFILPEGVRRAPAPPPDNPTPAQIAARANVLRAQAGLPLLEVPTEGTHG